MKYVIGHTRVNLRTCMKFVNDLLTFHCSILSPMSFLGIIAKRAQYMCTSPLGKNIPPPSAQQEHSPNPPFQIDESVPLVPYVCSS